MDTFSYYNPSYTCLKLTNERTLIVVVGIKLNLFPYFQVPLYTYQRHAGCNQRLKEGDRSIGRKYDFPMIHLILSIFVIIGILKFIFGRTFCTLLTASEYML